MGRNRVDKESDASSLVGRVAGNFAPASSCSFPLVQLQCRRQPTGRFGVRDLVEGRRLFSCQCERISRTTEGLHEASKQQGRDCRRRETKRAVCMRGSSEGEVGGTPLPQQESRVNSRAVPDLRANSSWRAGVSSWGRQQFASDPSSDGSDSDFPPTVQSQGVKLSRRARPLFWLCQSPPLAVTSSSGNSACPSAQSTAAKATCCFFASAPA